ncbi:MAG: DUF1844 domain-containing protein [Myxococcota bacterium]
MPAAADTRASKVRELDFSTFVLSLGSNAAMQLDKTHKNYNLALAQQTIDILAMLEQKTAGNLTKEEADLLRGLLYQTRLAFCEAESEAGHQATAGDPAAEKA